MLKRVPQGQHDAAGEPVPGTHDINITRPALQRALYAALPPGTVTCGAAFRSFEQRADGRVAVRLTVGGKEAVEVADVLVGADGIWSAVRGQIDGAWWPGLGRVGWLRQGAAGTAARASCCTPPPAASTAPQCRLPLQSCAAGRPVSQFTSDTSAEGEAGEAGACG